MLASVYFSQVIPEAYSEFSPRAFSFNYFWKKTTSEMFDFREFYIRFWIWISSKNCVTVSTEM